MDQNGQRPTTNDPRARRPRHKNEVGPRPATSIPPLGKLSWLHMPDPKARPATAITRRLPVATFELRGPSTGAKHGVAPGRQCLHGGSRSDCSERGVASDPVECRATAVLIRADASDVAHQARFGVRQFAKSRQAALSLLRWTWRRGNLAGIASRPAPLHLHRLRGVDAASPWPVVAGFTISLPLSCAGPFRLREKSLPRVPPASGSPIAGRPSAAEAAVFPVSPRPATACAATVSMKRGRFDR